MSFSDLVGLARPNYRDPEALGKPGFIVDAGPVSREVRHQESTLPDLSDDTIADLPVVLDAIDYDRLKTGVPDSRVQSPFDLTLLFVPAESKCDECVLPQKPAAFSFKVRDPVPSSGLQVELPRPKLQNVACLDMLADREGTRVWILPEERPYHLWMSGLCHENESWRRGQFPQKY